MGFMRGYGKLRTAIREHGTPFEHNEGGLHYVGNSIARSETYAVGDGRFTVQAVFRATQLTRQRLPGVRRLLKFGRDSQPLPSITLQQDFTIRSAGINSGGEGLHLRIFRATSPKELKALDAATSQSAEPSRLDTFGLHKDDGEPRGFLASEGRVIAQISEVDPGLASLVDLGPEGNGHTPKLTPEQFAAHVAYLTRPLVEVA
jgi:hypothetical protein